jgi:hypothetical protein
MDRDEASDREDDEEYDSSDESNEDGNDDVHALPGHINNQPMPAPDERNQLQIELDDMNRRIGPLSVPYVLPGVEFANISTFRVNKIGPNDVFDKRSIKHSMTSMDPHSIEALIKKPTKVTHGCALSMRINIMNIMNMMFPPIKTIYYCVVSERGYHNTSVTNLTRFRTGLSQMLRTNDKPIYFIKIVNGVIIPFSEEDRPIFHRSAWNITEIYEGSDKKHDPYAPNCILALHYTFCRHPTIIHWQM